MLRHGEVTDQELGGIDGFMNSVSRDMLCSDMVVLLTTGKTDTVCTAYKGAHTFYRINVGSQAT
jgi:hypothetical protein